MRKNKRYTKIFLAAAAAILITTGCETNDGNTESDTASRLDSSAETQAVLEKVTRTSADGNVSIILPDSNWINTRDEDGLLVFVSEGQGEIRIDYADTKEKVDQFAKGATEKKLKKKLEKLGIAADNVEISNFAFDKSTGVRLCSYTLKYKDTTAGVYYTVTSVSSVSDRGYQISGTVNQNDSGLLEAVQNAVNSVLVLRDPLSASVDDSEVDTEESEKATEANAPTESEGSEEAARGERFFFDEPGNRIYVNQDSEGNWIDENGMVYTFYETWVEDQNGTVYYYDQPEYRSESAGNSEKEADGDPEDDAKYYDFYDRNGNYIKAVQDANGNWVGDDGKVYIFGEDGVTDEDGNFNPY